MLLNPKEGHPEDETTQAISMECVDVRRDGGGFDELDNNELQGG
jgi:hypothetical protein